MRIAAVTLAVWAATGPVVAGSVAIGEKLAPFTLKDHEGRPVDTRSFEGRKAIVFLFMATQCPVSNAYNTRIAALARDYAEKGVALLGINSNRQEDVAEIAAHAHEHGFTFRIVKDFGNLQADRFGALVTPEAYVYDSSWILRYHGRIDDSQRGDRIQSHDLRNALDSLLAGREVPVAETKAFGCTIKRVTR